MVIPMVLFSRWMVSRRNSGLPRGDNGRSYSTTVAGVSGSAPSHDPRVRVVHCQPNAPQFRSARAVSSASYRKGTKGGSEGAAGEAIVAE